MNSKRILTLLVQAAQADAADAISTLEQYAPINGEACNGLGYCYEMGYGVAKDEVKAVAFYQEAAAKFAQGIAMCNLGLSYQAGRGVPISLESAAHWYKQCAKLNDRNKNASPRAISQLEALAATASPNTTVLLNLGVCYEKGYGVGRDGVKAMTYYIRAANLDDDRAMCRLGHLYHEGNYVTQSLSHATYWYRAALQTKVEHVKGRAIAQQRLTDINQTLQCTSSLVATSAYAAQALIDFRHTNLALSSTAKNICDKWDMQHAQQQQPCYLLTGQALLAQHYQTPTFAKGGGLFRCYITAHCWKDKKNLTFEDSTTKVNYADLARALKPLLTPLIKHYKVVISLVACCAGKGTNSFAAKFHYALYAELECDVPVIARTAVTNFLYDTDYKVTMDLATMQAYQFDWPKISASGKERQKEYLVRKQAHSKVIFMMNSRQEQVVVDAYLYPWKTSIPQTSLWQDPYPNGTTGPVETTEINPPTSANNLQTVTPQRTHKKHRCRLM